MADKGPYPVAARDALFALLLAGLRDGAPLPALGELLSRPQLSPHRDYVRDRRRRMEKALKARREAREPLETGRVLFNAGLFFDCHEYLESFWKSASGRRRLALQGLIQAGAAFHKLELDPRARGGAVYLLERARDKLGASGAALAWIEALERWRRTLAAGRVPRGPRLAPLKSRPGGVRLPGTRTTL